MRSFHYSRKLHPFSPFRFLLSACITSRPQLVPPKSHPKKFISLSIGDPAVYGNLIPAKTGSRKNNK